ncbi:MAG: CDP-alcohol phosphatidyltransferase family protein [Deltaproteobacteria bacterium]|nr:CDP-alcohol phosphatidyltransferase family protein [Deltaproteobacteria bacterium]
MKDAYFIYGMLVLAVFAAAAYGVRVMVWGVARSERVAKIGGTALVGQELMDWTYWAMSPIVRGLTAMRITPNMLTWTACVLGFGAGVALAFGWFGLAVALATWSTLGDILDGQVARMTNTGSDRGELLDAAVDRYTELAFLGGLVIFYRTDVSLMVLTLAALAASFMISYASAKAEALHVNPPRGLMRRHERAVYLITGAGISALLGDWLVAHNLPWTTPMIAGLLAVAIIGNAAAVIRLVRIGQMLPK